MQNTEGKTMVIGPQFRPRDRSYCAVYHTPHVASAVKLRNTDAESSILCTLLESAICCKVCSFEIY